VVAACEERGAALQQAVGRLAFRQRVEQRGLVVGTGRKGIIGLPGVVVGQWCGAIVVRSHPRLS
jgi:hypothetical protein